MVMSDAERQRNRRMRLRAEGKKLQYVAAGPFGEFSIYERISNAVRNLIAEGDFSEELQGKILDGSLKSLPLESAVEEKYVKKIITSYLNKEKK